MCRKLPLKIVVQAVTEKCSINLDFKVNILGILFKNFKIYDFIEIFKGLYDTLDGVLGFQLVVLTLCYLLICFIYF